MVAVNRVIASLFVTFMCLPIQWWSCAQTDRAVIRGRIIDEKGTTVPDARIQLLNENTGQVRTVASSIDGEFAVSQIPAGTYRLEVEMAGYRKHIQKVELQINHELRLDISLQIGPLTEEIIVSAPSSLLRKESTALGTVIENHFVSGLPLDGRNFLELSLLVPGAVPAAPGSAASVRGDFAFSVNGGRESANNFLLDGAYNIDPKLNTFAIQPPVDAIQEFEIVSGTYDASFGRSGGAQVNVILNSGSNLFHGTIYEFHRNGILDARNFFAPSEEPNSPYQRNQFGFSLGGPIVKNQTFFFVDYEGRRVREGITRVDNVPTLEERSGDFSQSLFPKPNDPFIGQAFPGGKIPEERLSPVGLAMAALYPEPNRSTLFQNYVSSPSLHDRNDQFDVRFDHSIVGSGELFFRYSFGDRDLFEPFSGPTFSSVPGFGTDISRRAQNIVVGHTLVMSPNFVSQARSAFSRVSTGAFHENTGNSINSSVGLPELSANPRDFGLSFTTVSGFSPLGDEFNNPQHSTTNTFQIVDTATYLHGQHLLKFGFDVRAAQQNAFRDVQSRGFLTFTGQAGVSGNALADLLLGFPYLSGGAQLDNHQHLRTESYNLFLHDSYRAAPNLTLSAGIRYEYNSPPVDTEDRANIYDPNSRSLVQAGTHGIPRSGYEADRNNWAPRLGLAWAFGSERTNVLRAGYGVYFDQSALAPGEGLYFNAPFFDFRLFFSLPGLPLTLNDPFPIFFPFSLPQSALSFQPDLRTAYMQHWNLGWQQQLNQNRVFEVAYVGSKGTKLLTARDINQPGPSPQQPNPRPVLQFDDINLLAARANSTYHGLQLRFHQRLHSCFSMLSSYTWSKSLDDASNFFSSAGDPNFPQDSFNLRAEKGRSNFDVRHRLSVSYSYQLPVGRGHRLLGDAGWISSLLTGWQTFGILTLQSGRPFTVALLPEIDNSNTGRSILGFGANDRPDLLDAPQLSDSDPDRWFNTDAFAIPPQGNFGNSGRNILDGPGFQNLNASLVKHSDIGENLDLEFRFEVFNLFNHPNFNLPDIFLGSSTFGHILSAQNPRHIQFGLKLLF